MILELNFFAAATKAEDYRGKNAHGSTTEKGSSSVGSCWLSSSSSSSSSGLHEREPSPTDADKGGMMLFLVHILFFLISRLLLGNITIVIDDNEFFPSLQAHHHRPSSGNSGHGRVTNLKQHPPRVKHRG